jgi:hypothetical protein
MVMDHGSIDLATKARELRAQGATLSAIAKELGRSESWASNVTKGTPTAQAQAVPAPTVLRPAVQVVPPDAVRHPALHELMDRQRKISEGARLLREAGLEGVTELLLQTRVFSQVEEEIVEVLGSGKIEF